MKVYLAARYSRREEMVGYAEDLKARGYEVVSSWVDGHHETRPNVEADPTLAELMGWAAEDIADLVRADMIVLFPGGEGARGRGGKDVEFGIALGYNLAVGLGARHQITPVVIGPRTNVFTHLAGVWHFDTWAEFMVQGRELRR